jgi:hypothetical protein
MPPVSEYVARIVKTSIKEKKENAEKHQVVDFRKEPAQEKLI